MKNQTINIIQQEEANDFVGIKIKKDKIELFIPKALRITKDSKSFAQDVLQFLMSLSLATLDDEYINQSSSLVGEEWPIDSYLWIIRDFLENGYYYNREKKYYHDNKGKIDWKKTLKNTPIYSKGNLIYDKFVTTRMSASNDIIAEIYKLCLNIAVKRIGWIFNYNFFVEARQYKSFKEMSYLIHKEYNNTFDDLKRQRFTNMIRILENCKNENALSNYSTYGIRNYYYVFERMIDKFFHGIPANQVKSFNPVGYYKLNGYEEKRASELRPDTIVLKGGNAYIIDAKMYKFGYTKSINDLPKATSIQKQITYGDYALKVLKKNNPDSKVFNSFIIPFDSKLEIFDEFKNDDNIKTTDFIYIGKAYTNWRKGTRSHESIYVFLIDFYFLLKNYRNYEVTFINELIAVIDKEIKEEKEIKEVNNNVGVRVINAQ